MKISVLTMITKPDERQDMWREALENYKSFADEVVVVVGDKETFDKALLENKEDKVKYVYLEWPEDWDYSELPKHLNYGLDYCTGDWVCKLDIDQFIHEKEFEQLRETISNTEKDCLLFRKVNVCFGYYFSKGSIPVAFRNLKKYGFGFTSVGSSCIPVEIEKREGLSIGDNIDYEKTDIHLWNYNYFFKTKEISKAHFWRFVRAYYGWTEDKGFGYDEDSSWDYFIDMMKKGYERSKTMIMKEDMNPKHIREKVINVKPEQLGHSFWGKVKRME